MRYVLGIIAVLTISFAMAQKKLEFGDTPTTTKHPKYAPNHKAYKEKKPVEWVKNSPEGLLLGNKCMEEVLREMGIMYVLQTKNQPAKYRLNGFERFWHNLWAKLRITFRNGPFWKLKLKKRRRECRRLTG
ncbi:MAG: hypothetical protein R3345_07365, partial [Fulvivirga sp.]|nr:hypothetical protein [Fulvivirga sp.]